MSARDDLRDCFLSDSRDRFETAADAYRLQVIGERDAQIIAWLCKKAGEYRSTRSRQHALQADAIDTMADKLSRGAVRPPLSKDADPVHELSPSEQLFLTFALELAADQMALRADEFDAADKQALESLRRLAGEAAPDPAPDFYQPGYTYSDTDPEWRFRCDTVTTHPEDGERTALGWRFFRGEWDAIAYGEDDWDLLKFDGRAATGVPRG